MTCTCVSGYEVTESTMTDEGGRMVLTLQTVADPECQAHGEVGE